MKDDRGRKLTAKQKAILHGSRYNIKNWLCIESNNETFVIRHRKTGNTKVIKYV